MFERTNLLFEMNDLNKFINSNILIVGVGGVGGACLEALVRMGLKNVTVIDCDVFQESNLNRQLLCTKDNIGHSKVKEAVLRAKSINSDINIVDKEMFLNEANFNDININQFDYVIDCCDTVTTKYLLIKKCLDNNIKVISSMGTGNRVDPTKLEIMNIWKTNNDPLAKAMRKILKDKGINKRVNVLCSRELPMKIQSRTPGSTAFVPNAAGFCIASFVFNDIMNMGSDLNGSK